MSGDLTAREILLWETPLRQSHGCAILPIASGDSILFYFQRPEHFIQISPLQRSLYMQFPSGSSERAPRECDSAVSGDDARNLLRMIEPLIEFRALVPTNTARHLFPIEMVRSYQTARRVPEAVCSRIAMQGAVHQGTRLLDVGSGTGELSIFMAEHGAQVTGIDICESFLSVARSESLYRASKANFVEMNANTLCFSVDRYDVVVMLQVQQWIHRYWIARGIAQVLEPDGLLFVGDTVATPHRDHPLRKLFPDAFDECNRADSAIDRLERFREQLQLFGDPNCGLITEDSWTASSEAQMGLAFATALLFPRQIEAAFPNVPDPHAALAESFDSVSAGCLSGKVTWCVTRIRKQRGYCSRRLNDCKRGEPHDDDRDKRS